MTGSDQDLHHRKLSTVAALIGKAQSTNFPAEQESLVLGAYSQLADYLNFLDRSDTTRAVRRERRRLTDRRGNATPHAAVAGGSHLVPVEAAMLPGTAASDPDDEESSPEVIDLRTDRLRSMYRGPDRRDRGVRIDLTL